MPELRYSVSFTTRPPRNGEVNGRDYYFISEKEFMQKKGNGELLEHAQVHGYWYGTSKDFIKSTSKSGHDILLDIDVQGGKQIKKIFPDAVLIFLVPPSMAVLESRLRGRRQDDETTIQRRLGAAQNELKAAQNYDYVVLNENFHQAVFHLNCIIISERLKMHRNPFSIV